SRRTRNGTSMSADAASPSVRPGDPCSFVIFGASGDLTRRLLIPALYNLGAGGLLPDAFAVIGVARKDFSNDAFRAHLEKELREFATRQVDERVAERLDRKSTRLNSSHGSL